MKLYIGNISPDVTEDDLRELYSQYGKLMKVDVLKDPETNQNRGYAFVEFENDQDGESAILGTNNTLLGGVSIQVSVSRSRLDQKRARQNPSKNGRNNRDNRENRDGRENHNNRENKRSHFDRDDSHNNMSQENGNYNHRNNSNSNPRRKFYSKKRSSYNDNRDNRNERNNGNNRHEDYNTKENSYNNNHNGFKKGVDYGRSSSPETSFLGKEDFGVSPRTGGSNYLGNNSNGQNNYNKKPFNNRRPNKRPNGNSGYNSNYSALGDPKLNQNLDPQILK